MKPETVAMLLKAYDEMAQQIGAESYDAAVEKTLKLFPFVRFVMGIVEKGKNRGELVAWLNDWPDLDTPLLESMIKMIRAAPGMVGTFTNKAAKSEMLPTPKGRPPISPELKYKICTFIIDSYGKRSVQINQAKQRAARRFGVSRHSVERIWRNREKIFASEDYMEKIAAGFKDVLEGKITAEFLSEPKPPIIESTKPTESRDEVKPPLLEKTKPMESPRDSKHRKNGDG